MNKCNKNKIIIWQTIFIDSKLSKTVFKYWLINTVIIYNSFKTNSMSLLHVRIVITQQALNFYLVIDILRRRVLTTSSNTLSTFCCQSRKVKKNHVRKICNLLIFLFSTLNNHCGQCLCFINDSLLSGFYCVGMS